MDRSLYKSITTKRGLNYVYASIPAEGAPRDTLLFVHGFPSSSHDWRYQVDFFRKAGFSLIIPDLLGAGETDKPTDTTFFHLKAMAGDIIDILDAEKTGKVILIGHDWGSILVSRLAIHYPERFKAYSFVAVGYSPTSSGLDLETGMRMVEQVVGYVTLGYWELFCEDGGDKIIEAHLDSWLSLIYPSDPALWKTDMAPRGAMKAWLLADKHAPLPSYFTEEDKKRFTDVVKRDGIASALNWYKASVGGVNSTEDKAAGADYTLTAPVLFFACHKDYVCVPILNMRMRDQCKNLMIKDLDAGHWAMLEMPDRFNADLLEWINSLAEKA